MSPHITRGWEPQH